jgi:N-carbamoyl-D-amino-acid hydrolase
VLLGPSSAIEVPEPMTRIVRVAAAQLGPIPRTDPRSVTLERLIALLRQAGEQGCGLVVFPELALTSFFPHWWIETEDELNSYFEESMPNDSVAPLFDEARALGIGFVLGYAELARSQSGLRRFNSSVLVDQSGCVVGKYRKVHLPGYTDFRPHDPFQNLEKRFFEVGDLGFPVFDAFGGRLGMCICNDRRWPETYRLMGLQGVELIALGYNTPFFNPDADQSPELRLFHNHLCMQAGAYQNSTWVVGVAKAGVEEGVSQMGGTCIIAPSGLIVAQAETMGDELVVADCDLDQAQVGKRTEFNFALHRRPELYGALCAQNARSADIGYSSGPAQLSGS